jgi:hypothetical protein
MPKRKIDPATGKPQLTYREQILVDEFVRNGGNGAQAAAAAGYKAARLDQAAYQALHRDCVQQHIRERIRESRVSADEIIGTLVSHMRGNLTEFFDESGNFSLEIARQKGIGHLLKSVSGTVCDPEQSNVSNLDPPDPQAPEPANVPTCKPSNPRRTFRAQLHSPLQAASILARLIGPDRHRPYRPLDQPAPCNLQPAANHDFDPNALLHSLIQEQMKEHGLSRDDVANRLLQVRPEFAKYLDELPPPPGPLHHLSLRDATRALAVVLDAITTLKSIRSDPTSSHPVVDAYQQIEAMTPLLVPQECHTESPADSRPVITLDDFARAVDRITARLSQEECESLSRLQTQSLIDQEPTPAPLAEDQLLDDPRVSGPGALCITDKPHPDDTPDPEPGSDSPIGQPATCNLQLPTSLRPSALCNTDKPHPDDSAPDPEPGSSSPNLQPSTCNLQLTTDSLDAFDCKYSRITRPYAIGQLSRFVDIIHDIMKNQSLTPQQAVDSIWLVARQNTWLSADLIDRCIADYAALDPRLARAHPPVSVRRPQSPPRYADDSSNLTSTQLFGRKPPKIRSD